MGGSLTKEKAKSGDVQANGTLLPGGALAEVDEGSIQGPTKAETNLLEVQLGEIPGTDLEVVGVGLEATGLHPGAVQTIDIQDGKVQVDETETDAVSVNTLGAAPEELQTFGMATEAVRATGIERDAVQITENQKDANRADSNSIVHSEDFFMMLVTCSAVALAISAIIFTNLPASPYPWIFMTVFFTLVLLGGLWCRKMELEKIQKEQLRKDHLVTTSKAIAKEFAELQNSCQELVSSIKNNPNENVQLILQSLNAHSTSFRQIYENCLHSIETSKNDDDDDNDICEQEKKTFDISAKLFQDEIESCKNDILQWIVENERQSLLTEIEDRTLSLMNNLGELSEVCTIDNISQKLDELRIGIEAYYTESVFRAYDPMSEIDQVKLNFELESKFKDFTKKQEDYKRVFDQKSNILRNIMESTKQVELELNMTLQMIPETSSEDFLDLEKFRTEAEILKARLLERHSEFSHKIQSLRKDVEDSDDNSKDTRLLFYATTISNDCKKELENLKIDLQKLKERYAVTPEGMLAREIKRQATSMKDINGLLILKLPVKLIHKNDQHSFRHYSLGENTDLFKPTKVVMMVGMTGAGKSLMINNIVNYVYGVSFQDDFRFKLILEDEEISERGKSEDQSSSTADSMTQWVSSYTLHYQEGFRVPFSIVLIDTPGFGDTRGVSFDEKIVKSLKEFFSNETHPINELSCIGLVIQASQARLTAEQMYIFNSVLNIFGNNVTKNICLLFTFADAQPPPALETVKKEKIPFTEQGIAKFNNSAVYAGNTEDSTAYSWRFGFENLEKFFRHISIVDPASLTLTKEVLKERETLHLLLDGLQRRINDGFETLQSIESMSRNVMQLKGTMQANKDFKVKKTVYPQETKVVNHFITNCKSCMFTCHNPCNIAGDKKKRCSSMRDGKCVQCSGKCPWEMHSNGDRIYIYTKVETEETIEDMMDRYNIAVTSKDAKVKLLKELLEEYKTHKNEVFDNIQAASQAAQRLEEIALGKSLLSSVAYIDRLIDSERRSNKPNKGNRIEQLQLFKEKAELLNQAMENPGQLIEKMSRYEATVRDEIKKLEEKLETMMDFEQPSFDGNKKRTETQIRNQNQIKRRNKGKGIIERTKEWWTGSHCH